MNRPESLALGALTIVPAATDAAATLADTHRACFDAAAGFGEPWDVRAMGEILAMPGAGGRLARWSGAGEADGGRPVGLALYRIAADEAELLTLGVVPELRRRGIASRLVAATCAATGAAGALRLVLEVAEHNDAARRLYARLGFAELGYRRGYYAARTSGAAARTALVLARASGPPPGTHGPVPETMNQR